MPHPTVQALQRAQAGVRKAREARDKAIRASLAEGRSLRQVAREFDVSAPVIQEVRDKGD